ncbi:hypothetical protein [Gloeothece verrucosa]|uniref:Uncharacterized protein n=1 Tax=Gloeothece verrucosa (strain PCC 7822) TaxID=497965 RepID=E0UN82_GLOV7|nr:hypothetical protein [Gloeothece verrucosa]ADN18412.1 hypothetical protein Cyan7822_6736 [Gloeothece verrucosa PCC 7822]
MTFPDLPEKQLIRPQEIPLKYWNKLIEEIEKDISYIQENGAEDFYAENGFDLEISPDLEEAFSDIYKILALSREDTEWQDYCPECNSNRIIVGEGSAKCVDCDWQSFETDPPPYYDMIDTLIENPQTENFD